MKNTILLIALSLAVLNSAAAQTQTRANPSGEGPTFPANQSVSSSSRVPDDSRFANHVQNRSAETARSPDSFIPEWGNTAVPTGGSPRANASSDRTKLLQQTFLPLEPPMASVSSGRTSNVPSAPATPNAVYRVGVGDVLDIRLMDMPTRESTLFTVLKGGVIEYPLTAEPLRVEGLSTQEIALALASEIKVIAAPRVTVTVRDYASHAVTVTGFVTNPGRKIIRREAVPIFALLAEALPRTEASTVTLTRADGKIETLLMANSQAMATLVFAGDAVKVSASPGPAQRFVYIGGSVPSPGEKQFRDGMTLTQVLLAAGAAPTSIKSVVSVTRRNSNGFLTSMQYDVQQIADGRTQDPVLEPGDRIEVMRSTQ